MTIFAPIRRHPAVGLIFLCLVALAGGSSLGADTNSFAQLQGTYAGLYQAEGAVRADRAGSVSLFLRSNGLFSASLRLRGRAYAWSGLLDPDGRAAQRVVRYVTNSLWVQLQLDLGNPDGRIVGSVRHENLGWEAGLLAHRAVFKARGIKTPMAGLYSLVLPGGSDPELTPLGNGLGTVNVDSNGLATLLGWLADGTPVGQQVNLAVDGTWPLYLNLYGGRGLVQGWLDFGGDDGVLGGRWTWDKTTAARGAYYPRGFTNESDALITRYVPPVGRTNRVMEVVHGVMEFVGGNLPPPGSFTNTVFLAPNNVVRSMAPASNRMSVVMTRSLGLFSGTIAVPGTAPARLQPFRGIVVQSLQLGTGFILGTNQSGLFQWTALSNVVMPYIVEQPSSQAADLGGTVSFAVVAGGSTPLSYQWRRNEVTVPGGTGNLLLLANLQPTQRGSYDVVVSNPYGSITSSVAKLDLPLPPEVTRSPQSVTNAAGTTAIFSVTAEGTDPLTYQWRFNGEPLPGSADRVLERTNVQAVDGGAYDVVVGNVYGRATSSVAILTLRLPPLLMEQPQSVTAGVGATASFSVTARGGGPIRYQWRRNGEVLLGATARTLSLANLQLQTSADYDVAVSNPYGSVTSSVAVLTVKVGPTLTQGPQSRTNTAGSTASFTVTAMGEGPLGYQWRKDGVALPWAGDSTLWLTNVHATNAGTYEVVVTNLYGRVKSGAAILTVVPVPPGPPDMVFIPAGTVAMGDVFNEGNPDERPVHAVEAGSFFVGRQEVTRALWNEVHQWATNHGYRFEQGVQGKGDAHPVHSLTWYDAVKWCNARSEKEGRVPAYYTSASLASVYRTGQVDVQNDWVRWRNGYRLPTEAEWEKAARGGVAGERFAFGNTITHAQANYFSTNLYAYDVSPTRGFHPAYNDGVTPYTSPVGSFGANGYGVQDMVGNVMEWCWDWYDPGYYGSAPSADPRGPATGSLRALRGGSWREMHAIDCPSSNRGYTSPGSRDNAFGFRVVLAAAQRPVLLQHPVSQTVITGATVTLAALADGTAPMTYRWRRRGTVLAGATNAVLLLTQVQTNQAGPYDVVVANAQGSVTSRVAEVTILRPEPVFRSPWQMYASLGPVPFAATVSSHGNIGEYQYAVMPSPGAAGWSPAPHPETIGFETPSVLGGLSCRLWGAFTYFQTFLDIPSNVVVTNFYLAAGRVDDGVQVAIFNSSSPTGAVAVGAHLFIGEVLSGTRTNTANLAGLLKPGERNRIVLTHVDDCAVGSYLDNALLVLNGVPLPAVSQGWAPVITTQPLGQVVDVGTTASFGVAAGGATPLAYQWRRNGVAVPGATNATLRLSNLQTNQIGGYDVVVANAFGRATSSVAVLRVMPIPAGMGRIPAGSFAMGDSFAEGGSAEGPVHTVQTGGFYIDRQEVTKVLWEQVYNWALTNGYRFEYGAAGKAADHPAQSVTWYDAVKWCNARSEMEGRLPAYYTSAALTNVYRTGRLNLLNEWVRWNGGYRLPTEAEWEKAARGGVAGERFALGNTIAHAQANYQSSTQSAYDVSPTRGFHPGYTNSGFPYTSPVGSFAANGYGLHDMAGNVYEWCWDQYSPTYYGSSPELDPRGPAAGSGRVLRGGGWNTQASGCRSAYRYGYTPDVRYNYIGFRVVLAPGGSMDEPMDD